MQKEKKRICSHQLTFISVFKIRKGYILQRVSKQKQRVTNRHREENICHSNLQNNLIYLFLIGSETSCGGIMS